MVFAPYAQFPEPEGYAQMMIYSTLPTAVVAESVKRHKGPNIAGIDPATGRCGSGDAQRRRRVLIGKL
jgi:hypothetical protein